MKNYKVTALEEGHTIITSEKGNSMFPLLKSGQKHELTPTTWEKCEIGDIVFCKIRGRCLTHLVIGKNDQRGLLIANKRGHINGWTTQVYGKVTDIL